MDKESMFQASLKLDMTKTGYLPAVFPVICLQQLFSFAIVTQ